MKRREHLTMRYELLELPEARPMPWEANPNGIEGVESGWPGGSSNIGEVMFPWPDEAPYSLKELEGVPRVDAVLFFQCDRCGQAFQTDEMLNVHTRTAHRRRR